MPEFQYQALAANGKPASGKVSAASLDAARAQLAEQGLTVTDCIEMASTMLSPNEAMDAARHVGNIVLAGLPLASGLQAVSDELAGYRRTRRLAGAIGDMAQRLEAGASVDSALAAASQRFPAPWQGVIEAGVRSGGLQDTLAWFVETQQSRRRFRRQFTLAIGYPAMMLIILFVLNMFMGLFVMQPYLEVVDDFGAELPTVTVFVVFLTSHGWQVLLAVVAVCLLALGYVRLAFGQRAVHRVIHFVPVVGRVYFGSSLSAFAGLLALLLKQSMALPDALRMVGLALSDRALGEACCLAADDVAAGKPLAAALGERYCLLRGFSPVLQWGEENGMLAAVLQYLDKSCEGWAEFQTDYLKTIVPPFTLFFILWIVTLVVSGLFMPMINLMQVLT